MRAVCRGERLVPAHRCWGSMARFSPVEPIPPPLHTPGKGRVSFYPAMQVEREPVNVRVGRGSLVSGGDQGREEGSGGEAGLWEIKKIPLFCLHL